MSTRRAALTNLMQCSSMHRPSPGVMMCT